MHATTIQLVSIFFAALSSFGMAQESDSCPYADITPEHSFCLPPNTDCNIVASGVPPEDIEIILKVHNELRNKVAKGEETTGGLEPATNMLQLVWDEEIAAVAQKYAEQCKFEHDCGECRRITKDESVGQNIFLMNGKVDDDESHKADWEAAVRSWYSEVEDFDKSNVKDFASADAGHFTQVIWAESGRIGCGFVAYESDSGYTENLHICNYAPVGNVMGGQIYEEGDSCSNCPEGSTCGEGEYDSLCVMSG